jgi:hypothetical protein
VDVDGRLDERLRFGLTLRSWVGVKRWRWPLEFAHKIFFLDCTRESVMAMAEEQGLIQFSSVCTILMMLWHLFLWLQLV